MKRRIFLIICIFCSVTLFSPHLLAKVADSRDIRLIAETQDKDARSVQPVRAWLDGTTLQVSFLNSPASVTIRVTDPQGAIVKEVVVVSPYVQIPIEECSGLFRIEIVYTGTHLYGEFEYEE